MARIEEMGVHESQPSAVSLSQATELGTVYRLDEIGEISRIASGRGLGLHMDGARLANAVQRLACTPAELTWKAGVDILSFGATKNGAMAAEAVVVFNSDRAAGLARRHKRAGHLFSKMRFISAQLEAYLKDDLWLQLAEPGQPGGRRSFGRNSPACRGGGPLSGRGQRSLRQNAAAIGRCLE